MVNPPDPSRSIIYLLQITPASTKIIKIILNDKLASHHIVSFFTFNAVKDLLYIFNKFT